ncbi:MAG: DUF2779 domain-containing protein [Bdellovibrionales bacterium]
MVSRFLTKSRFKIGNECPTKLYYLDDKRYGNSNSENAFLKALAEGGFQVGELAKIYFEGGHEIATLDKVEALRDTAELLRQDSVVIYEAAIQFENLFIRSDILVKVGNSINLIEVKAKSFDPTESNPFYTKTSVKKNKPEINSEWEPYLLDVAFQAHVIKMAYPKFQVTSSLMLADKTAIATVDGLNQKFILFKDSSSRVSSQPLPGVKRADLGVQLLAQVCVDEQVKILHEAQYKKLGRSFSFIELVNFLSRVCAEREFVIPEVSSQCKGCEFRINKEMKESGFESGFEKCWSHIHGLSSDDFQRDFVFEIWNFRKSGKLIEAGKLFVDQLEEADIAPTTGSEPGLTNSERQWIQVESVLGKSSAAYLDHEALSDEMSTWIFPLHFIDFETTMAAIPFHRGRKPYEQIAFQFSHHIVHKDGRIEHADEFICTEPGRFPNFDFVRALRNSLNKDNGTIFRFAAHENTVLNQIKHQLLFTSEKVSDKDSLLSFIESITTFENSNGVQIGARSMVDLCELVKKYFYHPKMKGSNSIKKVLPAILNSSTFLKAKYSVPIYGNENGIRSKNFKEWTWVQLDDKGEVKDPYKILPPIDLPGLNRSRICDMIRTMKGPVNGTKEIYPRRNHPAFTHG